MASKILRNFLGFAVFLTLFFLVPKSAHAATVVINEFLPHPSSGDDWIELYNITDQSISVDNWELVDTTSSMIILSGNIDAKSFKVFEVSNRLNNAGDTITLKDQSTSSIDTYSYGSDPGIDISIGRNPDGDGGFSILTAVTKGAANSPAAPTSTLIPTQVPTPTNTPTPTKTPTPTNVPTPTKTPTLSPTPKSASSPTLIQTTVSKQPTTVQSTLAPRGSITESQDNDALPTAVLGEGTENITNLPSPSPSASNNSETAGSIFSKIIIALGVVFMAVSGILGFRIYKGKEMIPEFLWFRK